MVIVDATQHVFACADPPLLYPDLLRIGVVFAGPERDQALEKAVEERPERFKSDDGEPMLNAHMAES